jgi:predicted nicotinamide N-methyase
MHRSIRHLLMDLSLSMRTNSIYQGTSATLPKPALTQRRINLAGQPLKLLTVASPEAYLDQISDAANVDEDLIPYWGEVWPATYALASYIANQQEDFATKKVLELGCGLGALSTFLYRLGIPVLATDINVFALRLTRVNVWRNCRSQAKTAYLDWRYPRIEDNFERIVAADVVYEKRAFKGILNTLRSNMAPGGKALIAEPCRSVAGSFLPLLHEWGFSVASQHRGIEIDGKEHNIRIFEIS